MNTNDMPVRSERPERYMSRRFLGIILIIGGLSWLLFELFSRGTIAGIDLNLARSDSTQTIPVQRFAVARVEVTGVNDRVILNATTGEEVILSGSRHGFGWAANAAADAAAQIDVNVEQRGDTLYVNINRQPWMLWHFGRNPYAQLEVALPPDVTFSVSLVSGDARLRQIAASGTVTTIDGDIYADGMSGRLAVSTTSGDIDVRDHRGVLQVTTVNGDLSATGQIDELITYTTSGDVNVRGALGTVQVTTVSGDVTIETVEAVRLEVSTTSGKVSFTGRLLAAPQQVNTISGDITLILQSLTDAHLAFSTVSGWINVPDPLASQVINRRSLTATLGEGGVDLKVTSMSGHITAQFRSP